MARKLNPWFVGGAAISVLWFAWLLYVSLFTDPVNEYEGRPPVWTFVLFGLLPAFFTLYVIPRRIDDDDGRKWWHRDVIYEGLARWAINIAQVAVAIFVIGGAMQIGMWYLDPEGYYEINEPNWLTRTLARCESLQAEIASDHRCIDNSDCSLTRDELAEFDERKAKYSLHCEISSD